MDIRDENGSYTVEASISLFVFIIVIYTVFLQINTMIVENVMQKAVNNFAMDVSGFSYILERSGLVPEAKSTEAIDNVSAAGAEAYNNMGDFVEKLYENPQDVKDDAASIGSSFKNFLKAIEGITTDDLKTFAVHSAEEVVKEGINTLITTYCQDKLKNGSYLPMEYNEFCRVYCIDNNEIQIHAFFMSGDVDNFTVLIWAECRVSTPLPLDFFDHRKIVKVAYSPLWVK